MTDRLDALRLEIDRLDGALQELLVKRGDLVARERLADGAGPVYRPARDAAALRAFAARHSGPMPFPVVARILRELLMSRGPVEVHLLAPDDSAAFFELARGHFGTLAILNKAGAAISVMERVRTGALGLLPMPGAAAERWWLRLCGMEGAPKILARLPVLEPQGLDASAARGFVLGAGPCEPSGEDKTLIAVAPVADTSPSGVERALSAVGFKVALLDRVTERGRTLHLFEADGFVREEDAARARGATIEQVYVLGAYPAPLLWPPAGVRTGDVVPMPIRPGAS